MTELRTNAIRVYLETFINDERLTVRKQLNDLNADVKELTYRIDTLRDQLKTNSFGRLYGDIYFDHNVYDLEVELEQIIKVRDMIKDNKTSLQDIVSTMTLEDVNEWKDVFEWYNSNFKISEYVLLESENLPTIEKFIVTEDSYVLAVLSDGTITNGDMTFENIEELTHPIKGVDVFEWEDEHYDMPWSDNQRQTVIYTLIEQKIIA